MGSNVYGIYQGSSTCHMHSTHTHTYNVFFLYHGPVFEVKRWNFIICLETIPVIYFSFAPIIGNNKNAFALLYTTRTSKLMFYPGPYGENPGPEEGVG